MKKDAKPLAVMETALTVKEAEEAKRYQPKVAKKNFKPVSLDFWEEEVEKVPSKEDRRLPVYTPIRSANKCI